MATLEQITPFSMSVRRDQHEVVLSVAGELDLSTAPELVTAIARETQADGRTCLDLADCTFIDSSGLQVIVSTAREFRRAGGELSVTQLRGDVAALFRISGLLLEGSALAYRP